jgi:tetratricopeptide (TPR) repeat protein
MRSTSVASLLIGFGIGFAAMYVAMMNRAPLILQAMPKPCDMDPTCAQAVSGRQRAQPAFDAKRFKELQETVSQDPKNVDALMELGDMHAEQREFTDAITWYEKALAVRDSIEVRKDLGVALLNVKRPDEAIAHLKKALEFDPADAAALFDLGFALLYAKDDPDGAIKLFEKLIELHPDLRDIEMVKRDLQIAKENRNRR